MSNAPLHGLRSTGIMSINDLFERTMPTFTNPQEIAEAGERIYNEKYKAEYERKYPGKFVAIDVESGQPFLADQPEEALTQGRKALPTAFFHLIRVGAPGAFGVSYVSKNARSDWLFR